MEPQYPPQRPMTPQQPPETPAPPRYGLPKLPDSLQNKPDKKKEGWKSILSTVLILVAAPLVALTLTAFVFQSYEVEGPSMETTLQNQDRLIVLKLPRTIARITGNNYIPNRGDVVIFVKHGLGEWNEGVQDKQLIKRVIALPGERVVVRDGVMTVFNQANPGGFVPDKTLPYGSVIESTPGDIDVTVGSGQVFVSGDNRINSLDSRSFGPIDSRDIVGKLVFRVFPLSKAKVF